MTGGSMFHGKENFDYVFLESDTMSVKEAGFSETQIGI
jgi:hypothetical protein